MPRIVDVTPASHATSPLDATDDNDGAAVAAHRNAPQPDPAGLYGLIGDVARAGSEGTETNAVAIAANFMAYLSCAVGRGVYLPIGNTRHHARLFCLHVGRSGRGRKGDAVSLTLRIDLALRAMDEAFTPQIHRGGLSTREGLVAVPLVLRDVRGGHGEGLLLHAGINAGGVQEGDLINVALDGSSIDLFDGALQIAIELFVTRCKSEVIDQCAGEAGN